MDNRRRPRRAYIRRRPFGLTRHLASNSVSLLQVELVAGGHPAVAGARLLHEAERRERHVEAGDCDFVGCDHVENAFTGCDRHVLYVIEASRPFGLLDRYDVVVGNITPNEQALVVAFDVEGEHARRVAVSVDGADAGDNLAVGLEKRRLLLKRYGDLLEHLEVLLASLAHLAFFPKVKQHLAEGNI